MSIRESTKPETLEVFLISALGCKGEKDYCQPPTSCTNILHKSCTILRRHEHGAELIINPTLTPTKDREMETLMVRTTAAQQQAYYIDVNSCGDQGCGLSIAADSEGNILHQSSDREDLFTIDVDFDVSHNSRIKGFMNLGQNLKSYRDNRFNELMDIPQDKDYLDSLGDLIDFNKEK